MNLNYEFATIAAEKIFAPEDGCRISHECEYPALAASIAGHGLISPLTVCPAEDRFEIVSGFKRFDALLKAGGGKPAGGIQCLIARNISPADRLLANIFDNASSRGLDPVEKGNALRKLAGFFGADETVEKYMPAIGLKRSKFEFERFVSLCGLESIVKTALVEKKLPLEAALQLTRFSGAEQAGFMAMAAATGMGANLLNETARLLFEAAMQHGKTPGEIMAAIGLGPLCADPALDSNRRTETLRARLHALRRPMYESTMGRFRELAGPFEAARISLNPFPYFEKDEITVKFTISSRDDIARKIIALGRLKDSPLADEFLGAGPDGENARGKSGA